MEWNGMHKIPWDEMRTSERDAKAAAFPQPKPFRQCCHRGYSTDVKEVKARVYARRYLQQALHLPMSHPCPNLTVQYIYCATTHARRTHHTHTHTASSRSVMPSAVVMPSYGLRRCFWPAWASKVEGLMMVLQHLHSTPEAPCSVQM
eukprot:1156090-Pelagomonas_calceolata.AAC.12